MELHNFRQKLPLITLPKVLKTIETQNNCTTLLCLLKIIGLHHTLGPKNKTTPSYIGHK